MTNPKITAPSEKDKDTYNTSPPMLAGVLAYVMGPLFIAITIYALWTLFRTAMPPGESAAFYAHGTLLVISIIALTFSAWVASGRYARHASEQRAGINSNALLRRARYAEDMLRVVGDNIPNVIFVADKDGRLWFANADACRLTKKESWEVTGKPLEKVFPARSATVLLERIRRAHTAQAPVITLDKHDEATGPRYMETYYIPLPDGDDLKKAVLVTQKDITGVIVERERQEQTFRQLIDTLIAVVDRRDPFAAGHSLRVGMIAKALASQMGLDDQNVEAAHIAGSLMNLGKVLVPREILTKTTPLDTEELKQVRKAILTSADILSLISFQTPVVPTLRQVLERFDGKGVPEGRRSENILLTARIVTLANAFIAMVSPRAHRVGMSMDKAIEILHNDTGTIYDPRVVEALLGYLQKNPDMRQSLTEAPPELRGVLGIQNMTP